MSHEEANKKLKALSFIAGMNQRYYQRKWTRYSGLDKTVRIAVGVAALVGAIYSIVSVPWAGYSQASAVASVISLAMALVLNIAPTGVRESYFRDVFRRWSDLREDVDTCLLRLHSNDKKRVSEDIIASIQSLEAKKNRINALEQQPDEKLLERVYKAEHLARTGRHFVEPENPVQREGKTPVAA